MKRLSPRLARTIQRIRLCHLLAGAGLVALLATGVAHGQAEPWLQGKPSESVERNPRLPVDPGYERAVEGSKIDPQLGVTLPLDLTFVDDTGASVTLADYFGQEQSKPCVLTLTYFTCPSLCGVVMKGLVNSLKELDWRPGYEFNVINVSIDPRDTPAVSAERKASHMQIYGRQDDAVAAGWHYLTGEEPQIRSLADTIGYSYLWMDDKKEYAHGAGLFVITPQGELSRVLPGAEYRDQIAPAVYDASEGTIGTLSEKLYFLMCWRWDPETGKYTNVAMNLMRFGALGTVLFMIGFFFYLNRNTTRLRSTSLTEAAGGGSDSSGPKDPAPGERSNPTLPRVDNHADSHEMGGNS